MGWLRGARFLGGLAAESGRDAARARRMVCRRHRAHSRMVGGDGRAPQRRPVPLFLHSDAVARRAARDGCAWIYRELAGARRPASGVHAVLRAKSAGPRATGPAGGFRVHHVVRRGLQVHGRLSTEQRHGVGHGESGMGLLVALLETAAAVCLVVPSVQRARVVNRGDRGPIDARSADTNARRDVHPRQFRLHRHADSPRIPL